MKIQVKIIKENEDGSANAQVDFDKAGLETLVQWGLVALLTEAIDKYKVVEPVKKGNKNEFTANLARNTPKTGRTRSKK